MRFTIPASGLTLAAALAALVTNPVTTSVKADTQDSRGSYSRLRCESSNDREQYCPASIAGSVRIVRQLSQTPCTSGRNWNWNSNGIRVWGGCRAEFEYRLGGSWGGGWGSGGSGSSGSGGGWGGGSGWGGGGSGGRWEVVTCQSMKDREQLCPAAIGGDVRLYRQLSEEPCREGRNWWWNKDGVRVTDGCRAEFRYRPRQAGGGNWQGAERSVVTCQSEKDRERFCPAPIAGDVRLVRQISDTPCREGRNWSWTSDGVRVRDGCRGDFEYRKRP